MHKYTNMFIGFAVFQPSDTAGTWKWSPTPITTCLFGHQSGLDEGSGQNSATVVHGIVFRVYLVFSKISIIIKYAKKEFGTKHDLSEEKVCWLKKENLRQA